MQHTSAISRVVTVGIIVAIIVIAGGGAFYISTLGSTSTNTSTSSSSSSSSTSTSSVLSSSSSTSTSSVLSSSSTSSGTTSSCPSTSSSSTTYSSLVKIGFTHPAPNIQASIADIAQSLGIFAQYGLSVDYATLSDVSAVSALNAGSVQLAWLGAGDAYSLAAKGANLTFLGSNAPYGTPFYLMGKSSITTPQQLIGQSVGVLSPAGSSGERAAIFILKSLGLNESQVKITYLKGANTVLTALLAGQISAGEMSPPRNIVAENNGFIQLGPTSTDAGFYQPDLVSTTPGYLSANPGIVTNFFKAYLVAYRDLWVTMNYVSGNTTNPDGVNTTAVLSIVAQFTGFNTSLVEQTLKIYQANNFLNPTMLPNNSTLTVAYNYAASTDPSILSLNLNALNDFGIVNQLNQPCGFVYYLYGGHPPPASA